MRREVLNKCLSCTDAAKSPRSRAPPGPAPSWRRFGTIIRPLAGPRPAPPPAAGGSTAGCLNVLGSGTKWQQPGSGAACRPPHWAGLAGVARGWPGGGRSPWAQRVGNLNGRPSSPGLGQIPPPRRVSWCPSLSPSWLAINRHKSIHPAPGSHLGSDSRRGRPRTPEKNEGTDGVQPPSSGVVRAGRAGRAGRPGEWKALLRARGRGTVAALPLPPRLEKVSHGVRVERGFIRNVDPRGRREATPVAASPASPAAVHAGGPHR